MFFNRQEAGEEVVTEISKLVDKIICLYIPRPFYAVAQGYKNWPDVSDEEVIKALTKNKKVNSRS